LINKEKKVEERQMSELGYKVIKHNNWLGSSSSEDEEK